MSHKPTLYSGKLFRRPMFAILICWQREMFASLEILPVPSRAGSSKLSLPVQYIFTFCWTVAVRRICSMVDIGLLKDTDLVSVSNSICPSFAGQSMQHCLLPQWQCILQVIAGKRTSGTWRHFWTGCWAHSVIYMSTDALKKIARTHTRNKKMEMIYHLGCLEVRNLLAPM